jgi:hypothetical protein
MTVCLNVISSTIPLVPLRNSITSFTLNGLKIRIKIPLIIFEKAFCEANPIITTIIPAPANNAVPRERKKGIFRKINIIAIEKIIKLTEFFRNKKFVGFTFKRSEYLMMKSFINLFNTVERTTATNKVPRINAP